MFSEKNSHIKDSLFDGQVNVLQTRLDEFGPVHPKHPDFLDAIGGLTRLTGKSRFFAPKLNHTPIVTPVRGWEEMERGQGMIGGELVDEVPGFFRTKEVSDGVIVSITGETGEIIDNVMIMAADCGGTRILAPNGELAVLHSSLQCVDGKNGASIIKNALDYFKSQGINPSELRMQIGNAARACCFGFNDPKMAGDNRKRADRLAKDYGDAVIRGVKYPPRAGGIGIDVPLIAARQAEQRGVKDISVSGLCTSCAGLVQMVMEADGLEAMNTKGRYGRFSSHLRSDGAREKQQGWNHRDAVVTYVD